MSGEVEWEVSEGLCTLMVNRPDALNALNEVTLDQLAEALQVVAGDPGVRGIIITGAGSRAFVAGADIREINSKGPLQGKPYSARGQKVFELLELSTKPVIAAVNGFCLGGGCELALACHLRVAAQSARFGQPEVKLGLIPGFGGTQRMVRLLGLGRALELLLTGDMISAQRAYEMGLVNLVVADNELIPATRDLAGRILQNGPLAIEFCLEAAVWGGRMALADGMLLEQSLFGLLFSSEDMREGTAAFLEKRKPEFKGR